MSGAEQIVTLRERTFHGEKGTIMQKIQSLQYIWAQIKIIIKNA